MKLNELKRKAFFWIDKLQISRTERVAITLLLVILGGLLTLNYFLAQRFNFNQENYNAITAEFERRSAIIQQQEKELEKKYNPELSVSKLTNQDSGLDQERIEEPDLSLTEKININTANSAQLQLLDGIGPSYAARIIEYRETNGNFDSIDELVNVKGIGKKRLENIRPFIKLED